LCVWHEEKKKIFLFFTGLFSSRRKRLDAAHAHHVGTGAFAERLFETQCP
jgi:hypothetical protein